jgi:hypothetical protein
MDADDAFDLLTLPAGDDDQLTLELGSWEGPLDLLLTLARNAEG